MDFVIGLPQSADWRGDSYDLILVIVNWLIKIIYYEPVQTIITVAALTEVILNIVIRYYGLPDFIISDRGSVFTSKFWSSLCYFLSIKRRLFSVFYPQVDGQTERQNSIIEAYLRAFVKYKQDNWARFLPIAEFAYNNAKYAIMKYTPFKLNYGYHSRFSYKYDIDPYSRSIVAD